QTGNITLGSSANGSVTCTYTNTKKGHIIIDKVTTPSGDSQNFDFTTSGAGYTGFSLTDAAAPNDQALPPGTYSVTEGAVSGWDLTNLSCSATGTSTTSTSGSTATTTLAAGSTVTCTYSNTKRGTILIQKNTAGGDAAFGFTTTGG